MADDSSEKFSDLHGLVTEAFAAAKATIRKIDALNAHLKAQSTAPSEPELSDGWTITRLYPSSATPRADVWKCEGGGHVFEDGRTTCECGQLTVSIGAPK